MSVIDHLIKSHRGNIWTKEEVLAALTRVREYERNNCLTLLSPYEEAYHILYDELQRQKP